MSDARQMIDRLDPGDLLHSDWTPMEINVMAT
jgi:hypothetical protein